MFVVGVLFVVFAMKLRLRRAPQQEHAHCPACGEYAGEQCCHGCHGEYDAVNAPFEREHHFAVHAEHHVCAQPAEQCAKQYARDAGYQRDEQGFHREGASQLASRHADGTQCGGFSGAFDHCSDSVLLRRQVR